MVQEQILVAKYVYDKLSKQINCSECVTSSRFNILNTLSELGIQIIEKDGSDRSLIDIHNELGRKIESMESHKCLKNKNG